MELKVEKQESYDPDDSKIQTNIQKQHICNI